MVDELAQSEDRCKISTQPYSVAAVENPLTAVLPALAVAFRLCWRSPSGEWLSRQLPSRWRRPPQVHPEPSRSNTDLHNPLTGGLEISLPRPAFKFAGFLGAHLLRWPVLILFVFRIWGAKACRIYSASYPAALKKFRHSVTEKSVMMSPSALVIVSKLRAARFRRSDLSFENAISIGFRSGE